MTISTRLPSGDRDQGLTPRRQKILNCIHDSVQSRGYPPSMREMADAVGLKSTSAVSYQLKILERMGHLTRDARMPRTVVEKPAPLDQVVGVDAEQHLGRGVVVAALVAQLELGQLRAQVSQALPAGCGSARSSRRRLGQLARRCRCRAVRDCDQDS